MHKCRDVEPPVRRLFGSNSTLRADQWDLYSWEFKEEEIAPLQPDSGKLRWNSRTVRHLCCCRLKNAEPGQRNYSEATAKNHRQKGKSHFPGFHGNIPALHHTIVPEHWKRLPACLGRTMRHKDRQREHFQPFLVRLHTPHLIF